MPEISNTSLSADANLRAYYKLEDNLDQTANNYDLTNNNSTTFTAAQFNNGANFGSSNTNKSLTISSDLGITGGAMSLNLWVKNLSEIGSGVWGFASQQDGGNRVGYAIFYEYNGGTRHLRFRRVRNYVSNDDATYTITMGTTDFYMITLTYDGSNHRGYVNGSLVTGPTASSGNGTTNGTDGASIGCAVTTDTGVQGSFASSLIDDVAFFSRQLTALEVFRIYKAKKAQIIFI